MAEWINNMTRELEGLEAGSKAKIHNCLLKTTLKKYQFGKRHAMMEFMVSNNQVIHLHSRQSSTRDEQMLTNSTHTRMDDQWKDPMYPKGPKQRNSPKQFQTHNMPTDDVENINSTNKGRNLLLSYKPWFIS